MTGTKSESTSKSSSSTSVVAQLAVDDIQLSRLKSALNEQVDDKQPAVTLGYHHYHRRKSSTTIPISFTSKHHRAQSLNTPTSDSQQNINSPATNQDHNKSHVIL